MSLLILPAAYGVGGYESAPEGLTTLIEEKYFNYLLDSTADLSL